MYTGTPSTYIASSVDDTLYFTGIASDFCTTSISLVVTCTGSSNIGTVVFVDDIVTLDLVFLHRK